MRQILSYIPNLRIEVMFTKHEIACMLMVLRAACCQTSYIKQQILMKADKCQREAALLPQNKNGRP